MLLMIKDAEAAASCFHAICANKKAWQKVAPGQHAVKLP